MSAFKFPDELLAQDIAIVGRKGSGKTYTAKGMVERLLAAQRRVCILDPTGVWWGLRSNASGKGPGFAVVVFGGTHADVAINEHSGQALAKLIATKNLPAIVDLSEMLIGQRHRFVTDFAESLYRDNKAPLHLIVDEADEFAPQQPLPETKRMLHHIDRIVRRGRVRGFRVMLITQRPAVLNKNVLTQANTLIAMRLTAPQDRNAINAWVEGQADKDKAREVLGTLAGLQRGEGWVWAPELGILERAAFPKLTTFDSSRTPENDETIVEPTKLAAVDLGEIQATFAAIQSEPTVASLSAELAKTRKELTMAQKGAPAIDDAEIGRRLRAAFAEGQASVRLPDLGPLIGGLKRLANVVQGLIDEAGFLTSAITSSPPAQKPPYFDSVISIDANGRESEIEPRRAPRAQSKVPSATNGELSGPQQRILDALAKLESLGLRSAAKVVVAAQAGASSKSSAFGNNLGALRTKGLIDYPFPGNVCLTEAGRDTATPIGRPLSKRDLQESFVAMVPRPQAAILRVLLDTYPRSLPKAELAEGAGASPLSSAFGNNLGALRTLGAIDYPSPGQVRATELLFPKT